VEHPARLQGPISLLESKTTMTQKYAGYDRSGNITAFYDEKASPPPSSASVIEITDDEWQSCLSSPGSKIVSDGALADAPVPNAASVSAQQSADMLAANEARRDQLMAAAALRVAPLADAEALGVATDAETVSLTSWRQYRVALSRVDLTNPTWPTAPAA
jgi:hypothetical protein